MNNIKMSDRFDLPVKMDEHFNLKDGEECFVHVADFDLPNQAKAAMVAINKFDANQERIAELEKELTHWKCNHDNVVSKLRGFTSRPDLTINRQQAEIKTLNGQVALRELSLNNAIAEIKKLKSRLR